jgi:hypothetical protein
VPTARTVVLDKVLQQIKQSTSNFPVFQYTSPHIKRPPDPSHNMRVDARHRRPAAVPRDLARASPALFAQKVLTHHKHHRISTPPLRKPPLAQKALRALRPLARPCGLDQIRAPSKNASGFRGARTSPTRRRCAKGCPGDR